MQPIPVHADPVKAAIIRFWLDGCPFCSAVQDMLIESIYTALSLCTVVWVCVWSAVVTAHVHWSRGTVRETECCSVRSTTALGLTRRATTVLFLLLDPSWYMCHCVMYLQWSLVISHIHRCCSDWCMRNIMDLAFHKYTTFWQDYFSLLLNISWNWTVHSWVLKTFVDRITNFLVSELPVVKHLYLWAASCGLVDIWSSSRVTVTDGCIFCVLWYMW